MKPKPNLCLYFLPRRSARQNSAQNCISCSWSYPIVFIFCFFFVFYCIWLMNSGFGRMNVVILSLTSWNERPCPGIQDSSLLLLSLVLSNPISWSFRVQVIGILISYLKSVFCFVLMKLQIGLRSTISLAGSNWSCQGWCLHANSFSGLHLLNPMQTVPYSLIVNFNLRYFWLLLGELDFLNRLILLILTWNSTRSQMIRFLIV